MRIEVTTPNMQSVLQELSRFPASVGRKHFRIALNAAAGVTKSAVQSLMPVDSGLAKRSIAVKVTIPAFSNNIAHHDLPARAVVGSSRKYKRRISKRLRGSAALAGVKQASSSRFAGRPQGPSAYLHLLEFGTKYHVVNAKRGRVLSNGKTPFGRWSVMRASAKRPMGRAFAATKDLAGSKALQKLTAGVISEAAISYGRTQLSAMRQLSRKIVNTGIRAIR